MYQIVDTLIGMSSSSIFSLPASFILVLLGSITLIVGIPVVLVGLSVWVSTRRASKPGQADSAGSAAVRRARTGRIGGLVAGADAVKGGTSDGSAFWSQGTDQPTSALRGADEGP